ncbi:MAG: hypothetical protein K6A63_03150 [Acholeplasmatales bacterium]|nr:hypothetical protein [Acholeplasmatales bacterium]
MIIDAKGLESKALNKLIYDSNDTNINIKNALGQRYIASGSSDLNVNIYGIPGNALGAYLNGSRIEVYGNSSDALGDTMNDGLIVIHGNGGDTCGYSMRGGKIFVKGDVGYRCGIHMKAYMEKFPLIIVGGSAGNFLGEYQAGGIIVVLGLNGSTYDGKRLVGDFTATGMYGGKLFIRGKAEREDFPASVDVNPATSEDLAEISEYLEEYTSVFRLNYKEIMKSEFTVITPNHEKKPKASYVGN